MRSVENWFHDLSKAGSVPQQHHHLFTVKGAPRRRDVQRKLKLITAELRPRAEVKATELVSQVALYDLQHCCLAPRG